MPLTRGKKILLGCLIAVAALVIGFFLAGFLLWAWLSSPGPDLDTSRLVDPETGFYLELRLARDDPGARDLFRTFAQAQRQPVEMDMDKAPPWAAWLFPRLQELGNQEIQDEEIDKALPAAVIITAQQNSQGLPDPPLFAAHLPMTGRWLRVVDRLVLGWMMPSDGKFIQRQRGEESYLRFPDELPVWVAIVGTDVLISLDETPMVSGIDRLARTPENLEPAPLATLLGQVPGDTALRLAARPGQAQALVLLVEPLAPDWAPVLELLLRDAGEVRGWGALESADVLAGEIEIPRTGDPPLPRDDGAASTLTLERGPVRFVLQQPPAGGSTWRFRLEGLETLVRRGSSRLRQSEELRTPAPGD